MRVDDELEVSFRDGQEGGIFLEVAVPVRGQQKGGHPVRRGSAQSHVRYQTVEFCLFSVVPAAFGATCD